MRQFSISMQVFIGCTFAWRTIYKEHPKFGFEECGRLHAANTETVNTNSGQWSPKLFTLVLHRKK